MKNEKRTIGIVGLGKMGGNVARRLAEHGWTPIGYAPSAKTRSALERDGIATVTSLAELADQLPVPRTVWVMVPAKGPTEEVLFGNGGLYSVLAKGDTVIDAGNSFYKDSVKNAKHLARRGIAFLDAGFSGGPSGARDGGCLMIGGDAKAFARYEPLFKVLARPDAYRFFKGAGAGHFVKMVHNGIEYGMMQALAEGFAVLKQSRYKINLKDAATIYDNGSVIESRLVDWIRQGLEIYGERLSGISGSVGHTGEGRWTVETAKELGIPTPVIETSYRFRVRSAKTPSYTGKLLTLLRNQFGGHTLKH